MNLNKEICYSILTISPTETMPLRTDVVGLKAAQDEIPWEKLKPIASATAELAGAIAGLPTELSVPDAFENFSEGSDKYGFDIVLKPTQKIDPERINQIKIACELFIASVLNDSDGHTRQLELDPKLSDVDFTKIDSARTNFLEIIGNCKIPVPFICKIDDKTIICAGQYAKKPPKPARKADTTSICAKIEGTERHEVNEENSLNKFKSASCAVVKLTSKKRRTLNISSRRVLLDAHHRAYDRVFYTLIVSDEYGADDKVTSVLLEIQDCADINQPRLIADS